MKYRSYRLILPMILTILLINVLSSHGQRSGRLYLGGSITSSDDTLIDLVPPDGSFEIPISSYAITDICITEQSTEECRSDADDNLPKGTELISKNSSVASVTSEFSGDVHIETTINLHQPGFTILQLHRGKKVLASYALVVTPVPPGTTCRDLLLEDIELRVDCAQKCISAEEMVQRFGDGVCDDGRSRDDERPPIDLSCFYIPGVVLDNSDVIEDLVEVRVYDKKQNPTDAESQSIDISFGSSLGFPDFISGINTYIRIEPALGSNLTNNLNRDGGDCSPEESCKAQFETAPGFELCNASAGTCTFSFNAANRRSTCTRMCQRFGTSCVAALNNHPAGCDTVDLSEIDTCNTPRQSEICVCERR